MMLGDIGYLGRRQQGTELPLSFRADTALVPGWPDTVPTVTVYRMANSPVLIETKTLGADQQGAADGTFRLSLFLDGSYGTAGSYCCVIRYKDGDANPKIALAHFEILPGGSSDGTVIGMFATDRPNARFVIKQLDSGRLVRGRNPR